MVSLPYKNLESILGSVAKWNLGRSRVMCLYSNQVLNDGGSNSKRSPVIKLQVWSWGEFVWSSSQKRTAISPCCHRRHYWTFAPSILQTTTMNIWLQNVKVSKAKLMRFGPSLQGTSIMPLKNGESIKRFIGSNVCLVQLLPQKSWCRRFVRVEFVFLDILHVLFLQGESVWGYIIAVTHLYHGKFEACGLCNLVPGGTWLSRVIQASRTIIWLREFQERELTMFGTATSINFPIPAFEMDQSLTC